MAGDWSVAGTYMEACNCEAACPCVMLGAPTEGTCTVLVGWHVEEGHFDEVRLDGLNVALAAHVPGHMLRTKWRVALYLDERATEAQRHALGRIFSGQAGGHLAVVAGLIGEVLGVSAKRIDFVMDGKRRRVTIDGIAEAEIQALEGQGGKDVTIENHPLTPVNGFPAVVARSTAARYHDHEVSLEVTGKNGFFSPFAYRP